MSRVKVYPSRDGRGAHHVEVLPGGLIGSIKWVPGCDRFKARIAKTEPDPEAPNTPVRTKVMPTAKVEAVVIRHQWANPSNQVLWKVELVRQEGDDVLDEVLADVWIPANSPHFRGSVFMALKRSEVWQQLVERGWSIGKMWEAQQDEF